MPLCGFNQEMLEGMEKFHKGLVERGVIERSEKRKQTYEQTINKELEDMRQFLEETNNITDPIVKELTETLAKYACAYYKFVQKKGINNYKEVIQFLNNFYFNMDDKYYSELEGKPQAMKKLVFYLNGLAEKK